MNFSKKTFAKSCIHTIKLTKYLPIGSRIGYTANLIDSILVHFCTSIYNTTQIIFFPIFFATYEGKASFLWWYINLCVQSVVQLHKSQKYSIFFMKILVDDTTLRWFLFYLQLSHVIIGIPSVQKIVHL